MAKQSAARKRVASEDYESDGGFVEDAPKSKKSKQRTAKAPLSYDMGEDDDGTQYWEISGKRRLTISDFKGNTMVGVREFYEDKNSGKMMPGKKGISLNIDQFNAFVELLPQIEKVLTSKGIEVPRPNYDHNSNGSIENGTKDEDHDVGEDEQTRPEKADEDEAPTSKSRSKLEQFKHKANHEATSDEEE